MRNSETTAITFVERGPKGTEIDSNIFGAYDPRGVVKILLIADGSGSMSDRNAEQAIASLFKELGMTPDTKYIVTYVWFSDEPEVRELKKQLKDFKLNYDISGGTALWDAIHKALGVEMERREPVLCVIVSDGQDTSSHKSAADLAPEIKKRREEWGNWTFYFFGVDGAEKQAKDIGIPQTHAISISGDPKLLEVKMKQIGGATNDAARVASRIKSKEIKLLL